jgi:hypothetical protein
LLKQFCLYRITYADLCSLRIIHTVHLLSLCLYGSYLLLRFTPQLTSRR